MCLYVPGEDGFARRISELRQEIDANAGIAAIGVVVGQGADISALVRQAEMKMYDDKENFYRTSPCCKRGRTDS